MCVLTEFAASLHYLDYVAAAALAKHYTKSSLVVVLVPVGGVGLGQLAFEALFGEQLDELLLERADVALGDRRHPAVD